MNEEWKYDIPKDSKIESAGFQYQSRLEIEKEKIRKELSKYSHKSSSKMVIMAFFFGLHRLTNGKILSGLLYAFTGGGFLIWTLFDLMLIGAGKFTDASGRYINTPKVAELEMALESYDSKLDLKKTQYECEVLGKESLIQSEYYKLCAELGYDE